MSAPAQAAPTLPDTLRLGAVELTVTSLARSVDWYRDALGLRLHRREGSVAALGGGGEDLVVLHEEPAARPAGRHAGLFHYALLHPSRDELAQAAARLAVTRTPIQGASDHGTHEALYLADPDGNGIELAADRPREQWPPRASYAAGPAPLDAQALVESIDEPRRHVDEGLRMGHLHLHVGDLAAGLAFYRDLVGFEVQAMLPSAAFVSAGGYHPHLGFNTWQGVGVPGAPPGTVGLRHWTVELGEAAQVAEVRDRLAGAGVAVEDRDGGFLAGDPWDTKVLFRVG